MATDWLSTYNANLDIREQREAKHKRYIEAYTRLADRSAKAAPLAPEATCLPLQEKAATPPLRGSPRPKAAIRTSSPEPADLTTLRTQLAASNTARSTIQSRLNSLTAELATLQATHTTTLATITSLRRQIASLETRVRDRDDELRAKARMVHGVQDEMVGLTLALNLAEEKVKDVEGEMGRVRKENEDLVARWVRRVGDEAREAGISGETDYRGRGSPGGKT